jgi:hypothetical protein
MLVHMPEPSARDIDPLEGSEPPPTTFAQRRRIAAVGALAILAAVGTLVCALGRGATPVSAVDELGAARSGKARSAASPARTGE